MEEVSKQINFLVDLLDAMRNKWWIEGTRRIECWMMELVSQDELRSIKGSVR